MVVVFKSLATSCSIRCDLEALTTVKLCLINVARVENCVFPQFRRPLSACRFRKHALVPPHARSRRFRGRHYAFRSRDPNEIHTLSPIFLSLCYLPPLRHVPVRAFFFPPFCTSLPLNFLRFALDLSALISPEQRDYCGGVSVPPCSLPRVSVLRRSFETFPVFSARTLRRIYR